ncbi:hypothetical protein ACHAWF_017792, partial [Thalassiosira exigua]
ASDDPPDGDDDARRRLRPNASLAPAAVAAASAACLVAVWLRRRCASSSEAGGGASPVVGDDVLHAASGAIGSALSITLLYPLETVRTRLQVGLGAGASPASPSSPASPPAPQSQSSAPQSRLPRRPTLSLSTPGIVCRIARSEGFSGLYRGWSSLVAALTCLNFVYFYSFRGLRRTIASAEWAGARTSANEVAADLAAGYLAGCVAVLVTGPLWLVNTRLKLRGVDLGKSGGKPANASSEATRPYAGMWDCLLRVAREEGVSTLWNGTLTSLILALNPAIQLGVYEWLKRTGLLVAAGDGGDGGGGGGGLGGTGALAPFANALVAKFVATVVTYPVQVTQTRRRAGMDEDVGGGPGRDGLLKRMYRGLESKLLQMPEQRAHVRRLREAGGGFEGAAGGRPLAVGGMGGERLFV